MFFFQNAPLQILSNKGTLEEILRVLMIYLLPHLLHGCPILSLEITPNSPMHDLAFCTSTTKTTQSYFFPIPWRPQIGSEMCE
jgi:hypothetical protein